MPKIGIFWIYKKRVLGKACGLSEGQENVPGRIDCPYTHSDLWESDPQFVVPFPELRGTEYQEVPRGRVLYVSKEKKVIVYMDEVIYSKQGKQAISDFFELNDANTEWKTDEHYTTDFGHLDRLFAEDDD